MLNVIMLSVVMLNVVMLSVIMLNVVMLSVVMLNVVMLSVIMLYVVAPDKLYHPSMSAVCTTCSFFYYALAYSATAVSYTHKMFMKLRPVANVIKLFTAVSYDFS